MRHTLSSHEPRPYDRFRLSSPDRQPDSASARRAAVEAWQAAESRWQAAETYARAWREATTIVLPS